MSDGTRGETQGSVAAPRTAGDMLRMAREFLQRKGIEEARLEAELLVAHALGFDRLRLFLALDRPVTAEEIDRARDLLVRRGRREPTAYIVGRREFYKREFQVGKGVLVPRPETEHLVDRARELSGERGTGAASAWDDPAAPWIADLGTGSGCIALTCALELPAACVTAVDVSGAAVLCARANLAALDAAGALAGRVELLEGDGFDVLARRVRERGRKLDLLLSNPPYVAREEAATLAPEVKDYEPELALSAPAGDPDHGARRLLDAARELVVPGGAVLVELGLGQAPRVAELARARGFTPAFVRDLAKIERVLEVRV
ncbi:MAG: peptide chain release factor N(5)-glutamine methyltransferase [Planctomycetes bacterium]|nr:peptide chain release factor N(5)-glutamine methyltransferase [Planctomycetota bacterium]